MKSNINDFVAHITRHPLLIPNRYHVMITGPVTIPDDISKNCVSAQVPARSLATSEKFTAGPSTKVPYVEIYDDLSMTFRISADMYERALFDEWMTKVGGQRYGASYFNEIKGQIVLSIYHNNNQKMKTYKFFDAIPISLSESAFAYDNQEISTFTVQFSYHHYEWM